MTRSPSAGNSRASWRPSSRPADDGVRSRQVDVLEDAALVRGVREAAGAHAGGVDGHQLARLDLADEGGADDVQRAGLGGDDPAVGQPAQNQGAHAVAITGGVQGLAVGEGQAERAFEARQQAQGRVLDLGAGRGVLPLAGGIALGGDEAGLVRQQRAHDVGVAGQVIGEVDEAVSRGFLRQRDVVDQIAVVPQGDVRAVRRHADHGLGVLPRRRAGRGVSGVPHRDVPLEGVERLFVEDLRHQAQVLEDQDLVAVAHRDARGFLAAVLQGEQPVIGELGDVFAGRPDSEHAALFAGRLLPEIVERGCG